MVRKRRHLPPCPPHPAGGGERTLGAALKRGLAGLVVASGAMLAAGAAGPPVAPPSSYARMAPPKLAPPPGLAQATGFRAGDLERFKDALTPEERALLVKMSQALLAHPVATAIKRVAVSLSDEQRRLDAALQEHRAEVYLTSYQMPNDPSILLGTAKSYDGIITVPPRLVRRAVQVQAASAQEDAEDEWIYQRPEQACTGNLSYSLTPGLLSDLENVPPPTGLAVHTMNLLLEVEANPDPIILRAEGLHDSGDQLAPPSAERRRGQVRASDGDGEGEGPIGLRGGSGAGTPGSGGGPHPTKQVRGDRVPASRRGASGDDLDAGEDAVDKGGAIALEGDTDDAGGEGATNDDLAGGLAKGKPAAKAARPATDKDSAERKTSPEDDGTGTDDGISDADVLRTNQTAGSAPPTYFQSPYRFLPSGATSFAELVGRGAPAVGRDDDDVGNRLRRELAATVPAVASEKKRCADAHGAWREARAEGDKLWLFDCRDGSGRALGLSAWLRLAGDEPLTMGAAYGDPATGFAAELRLSLDNKITQLSVTQAKDHYGPEITWDPYGNTVALNFATSNRRSARPFTYDVIEWHESGGVKLVGHRRDGIATTPERSWYASGALDAEVEFDKDGAPTTYREWYENHRPAEETHLKGGQMQGPRRWWHENGVPAGELTYDRGEPTGPATLWYDDGTKGVALSFHTGRLDGEAAWWYDDGTPMYQGRFKDGQRDGVHKLFLAGGGVLSERQYKLGQANGTWVNYDVNGKALREMSFKSGQKDGPAVLRYKDGQPFVEMTWKAGSLDGPVRSFFGDGQLASTCDYEKDTLKQMARYYPGGEPALEGHVLDPDKGLVAFTALRQNGSPAIECAMTRFQVDRCHVFDEDGRELEMPPDAEVTQSPLERGRADATKKLAWHPERCGGYRLRFDYDAIINNHDDSFTAEYDTTGACDDVGLAQRLTCKLAIVDDKVRPQGCADGRVDDLRHILDDVNGPGVAPPPAAVMGH